MDNSNYIIIITDMIIMVYMAHRAIPMIAFSRVQCMFFYVLYTYLRKLLHSEDSVNYGALHIKVHVLQLYRTAERKRYSLRRNWN